MDCRLGVRSISVRLYIKVSIDIDKLDEFERTSARLFRHVLRITSVKIVCLGVKGLRFG
jgi:hypothetical protein